MMDKSVAVGKSMGEKKKIANTIMTVVFSILSVLWIYPIIMILFNSLKVESAISTNRIFELPIGDAFNGIKNFVYGISEMDFLSSFWYSLFITVSSVVLIILCCSMCAWYICRVNSKAAKAIYYLCVFSTVSYTHLTLPTTPYV